MSETIKQKNIIIRFLVKLTRNRNILVFLVFFVISAFLWFLNAINKEYTTDLSLPYIIKNLPKNMSIPEDYKEELTISVSGHGYNLLREEIEKIKLPLIIDFSKDKNPIKIHSNPNNCTQSFIITEDLKILVNKRFGDNIKLVKISPDTIYFNTTQTYSKQIAVKPLITFEPDVNYVKNGEITIRPDTVTVYGPQDIVDTMKAIYTKPTDLGIINDNHVHSLEINTFKNLRYSKTSVLIDIPMEKYTETSLKIPVNIMNAPEKLKIRVIPSEVSVSFKVPLSIFSEIDITDFVATANFKDIQDQEAEVSVTSSRPELQITNISPISVKLLPEQINDSND
ncbi:MAG: hypothetical protein JXR36_14755 [Bacteroidales bacterium]|nr:hypothetical protein [Bacteroidales bacterium]